MQKPNNAGEKLQGKAEDKTKCFSYFSNIILFNNQL